MNNTWNKMSWSYNMMKISLNKIRAIIWQDHLWFPPGVSFTDLTDKAGITYPKPQDLTNLLLYGIVMFLVRLIFDRWMKSAAIHLGIKGRRKVETNNQLENFFSKSSKHPKEEDVVILSKRADLSIRQIQRWFRRRRNYEKPNKQEKFVESGWILFKYTTTSFVGAAVLLPTSWFWDVEEYWRGYPYHPMSNQMYFYYMLEGALAVADACHIRLDIKQKDSTAANYHHIITLLLITGAYCSNFLRFGSFTAFMLTFSNIFLQLGKVLIYMKKDSNKFLMNGIFAAFTLSFVISKLVMFPYLLYSVMFHRPLYFDGFCMFYVLYLLVWILQIIFISWALYICKAIYKLIKDGKLKDGRSDGEESSDCEVEVAPDDVIRNH